MVPRIRTRAPGLATGGKLWTCNGTSAAGRVVDHEDLVDVGTQERRERLMVGVGEVGVPLGRPGEGQEEAVGEALGLALGAAVGAPLQRLDRIDLELERGERPLDFGDGGAAGPLLE